LYPTKNCTKKAYYDFWNITLESVILISVALLLRDLAGIGSAPRFDQETFTSCLAAYQFNWKI
jgi:hypothetical protein